MAVLRGIREFQFRGIYDVAAIVEGAAAHCSSFVEVAWDNERCQRCLARYSRVSILHYYIYATIAVAFREQYHDHADLYEEEPDLINEVEETLETYGAAFVPYAEFLGPSEGPADEDDYPFLRWFEAHEDAFEDVWEAMTDEVFQLLFANRAFLLTFNRSLANYLTLGNVALPASCLDHKGVLKRQPYVPPWAKLAVYCRDHGRCVLCNRDLSGLLSTDRRVHYDHIVPLNLWGVNDPCNLQMLCEECNLRKSGTYAQTGYRYPVWWDTDD